ncbi:MAG: ATP-binding protein [Deltaproteobacteria bacterium]|nr:ATP-binding protein [Deltaproteobacteria bacterium]
MIERIFVSSAQKEFAAERRAIRDFVHGDALLRRFFEVFLFEDLPATDRRADEVYLDEVGRCCVYVGLFGNDYRNEDAAGLSPTEREFDEATRTGKVRLIFVKGADDGGKHEKMRALIEKAGAQLIRRRFIDIPELRTGLYAALVQLLEDREQVCTGPFDAAACRDATLADLSEEEIRRFVGIARRVRAFPLAEATDPGTVLEHLHLVRDGRPTNAAVLLFGKDPQRFLISSEIKCAHFHGTTVAKPIPFYRTYKGTVFETTDQAVDFVLSKINLAVGTREHSAQAPVAYEMPPEVVREAVVNAVAHRDYTSNASVQVMLFSDRLEVWNPGTLPPSLTLEKLRQPHGSVPGNPLLAVPMYLSGYIERMGTGTGDMIARCRDAGLAEPEFALTDGFVVTIRRRPERAFEAVGGVTGEVTGVVAGVVAGEVTGEVARLILVMNGTMKRQEIQAILGLKHEDHFRGAYLVPALDAGFIEMTIPEKPTSRLQRYRLTPKGRAWLDAEKTRKK